MDKTNNLTLFLLEIANALRTVKGITEPINPQDFASLILSLSDGPTIVDYVGEIDANNVIALFMSLGDGNYTLKYETVDGTIVDNFADICVLTIDDNNAYYSDFIDVNIPPYAASNIGVYNASGDKVGLISIDNFKPSFGTRLYRFGLLSDVHDYDESDAYPSDDFNEALSVFNNKEDVEFTCICGDITQNGTEAELSKYKTDVSRYSPNTPVYTTTGNHDCVQGASSINETL